jgi:hypothetical protein
MQKKIGEYPFFEERFTAIRCLSQKNGKYPFSGEGFTGGKCRHPTGADKQATGDPLKKTP